MLKQVIEWESKTPVEFYAMMDEARASLVSALPNSRIDGTEK
jgi:hypothetical protein